MDRIRLIFALFLVLLAFACFAGGPELPLDVTNITGVTPIANGGTGQVASSAALAALGGRPDVYQRATSTTPVATTTYSTGFTYASGTISASIGGILQEVGVDYNETTSTGITFVALVATGTRVTILRR